MSSDNTKNVNLPPEKGEISGELQTVTISEEASSETVKATKKFSSSSDRQIKFERAQKCLENAALVTKRIKEHRKATAELLGKPFEEDEVTDTASEMASTMSERTGYSVATDTSATLSVQEALNIPGISESLANTLKQKELLMERIKQYKEISKRPMKKGTITYTKREIITDSTSDIKKNTEKNDLQHIIKEKENIISVLQVKMKALESTVLDLQEKIGEKDMIIEAKTKATSLMSDNLSKKEKDSLVLIEDTRHQMVKMQENFIAMELEWKDEKLRLMKEMEEKDERILNLEEENAILENSRFEVTVQNSKLLEELDLKNKEIIDCKLALEKLTSTIKNVEDPETPNSSIDSQNEKGSQEISNMDELTKRIELLEQLNCQIKQTNIELENKLSVLSTEKPPISTPKKSSPQTARKGGRNTSMKTKSPWSLSESSPNTVKKDNSEEISKQEMVIQSLNKEIVDKEYLLIQKDGQITELEKIISEKENLITSMKDSMSESTAKYNSFSTQTETTESENGNEINVNLTESMKELETKLQSAEKQISVLSDEVDAANKNMVKVKSNHKIKIKQMQKTIDNFSKISDSNAEITKLSEEVHQLTQKVAELEEEKGNLQLHLVDYDSGRLTESETYKKLIEIESLAESRLNAISVLETQKFDLVQELHVLQQKNIEMEDKLADMSHLQNEHIWTEMQSAQLEEEHDKLLILKSDLELIVEGLKTDKVQMGETIKYLEKEKDELSHKLENYFQENLELTNKLEKLSAEKVSSAESIEIVESLTSQEKLELEEYNKGLTSDKLKGPQKEEIEKSQQELNESLQKLTEESAELNKKIELFTLERQEVMEKMNTINSENEELHNEITNITMEAEKLRNDINILNNEKQEIRLLNIDLHTQIEGLKRERLEIMKEASLLNRPVDESSDNFAMDLQQEEKSSGEKGGKGAKSVKQLTKDILKLKNVIKEREAEIADCQMKILSLEEQQQKQAELLQSNESYESKLKSLHEDRACILAELNSLKANRRSEEELIDQLNKIEHANKLLQSELSALQSEHSASEIAKDSKIQELEILLSDYENQIYNYSNTLQVKDKQLSEYINQITKLNDVSQKLKSTIECLEEEKAKDQNGELVKSLNKQVAFYQKTLKDYEDKLSHLEDEKANLVSLKSALENKNANLENELKNMQQQSLENESIMQDLRQQQQKYSEDIFAVTLKVKERDEEIHEIKLQLRKESIENEKLRTEVIEKEKIINNEHQKSEDDDAKFHQINSEKNTLQEQYAELESKNKELMEKLKKFAITLKKKNGMYTELEQQYNIMQKDLEVKGNNLEIALKKNEDLQEKISNFDKELKHIQNVSSLQNEHQNNEITVLQEKSNELQTSLAIANSEIYKLTRTIDNTNKELLNYQVEIADKEKQIEQLNKKIIEYEINQKHNMNALTRISTLELTISQKETYVSELLQKIETLEQNYNKVQFGYDAKIQERDLYIENLESEMTRYKSRIGRLEESISIMEDRRHSLERKADQLDVQLQEKHKAYTEYASHEDELVNRLAILMDHDRVVEKQLQEIEKDNKDLLVKIQNVNEENIRFRKIISDLQFQCEMFQEKAAKTDSYEIELNACLDKIKEQECHLKRVTSEQQHILMKRTQDIEDLESEFNAQIENAIKDKKILNEKYEKINEHVTHLEQTIQEYKNNISNLTINLEEVTKQNQELLDNTQNKTNVLSKDYTEQYICEINNLNSLLNAKNEENVMHRNTITQLQINSNNIILSKENELEDLKNRINKANIEIQNLHQQVESLMYSNNILQKEVVDRDERIKHLEEKKTMTFEMNIPKTEGMIISSTIEELGTDPVQKTVDISSIESQIVTDLTEAPSNHPLSEHMIRAFDTESIPLQVESTISTDDKEGNEPVVVPKKAYLCYTTDTLVKEENKGDPFNSEDGWGFDDVGAESNVTMLEYSRLNEQILKLKNENEKLITDLQNDNSKLIKAMKKIRDLKANNDMLSNELKLSKQLSQPAFLDSAIEDELKVKIQELEKEIEELSIKMINKKRENDSIKKQNEVLGQGNDKLTEMKEKLDNELELWKFKFKEINDKMSSFQWESVPKQKIVNQPSNKNEESKLQQENEELQNELDEVMKQNKNLNMMVTTLKDEISYMKDNMKREEKCSRCESLEVQVLSLQNENKDILEQKDLQSTQFEEQILAQKQHLEDVTQKYVSQINELNQSCHTLKSLLDEANEQLINLKKKLTDSQQKLEMAEVNSPVNAEARDFEEKYDSLYTQFDLLKTDLEDSNKKKLELEKDIQQLIQKIKAYEDELDTMKQKLQNLNVENDQLLSTVTELRSSISSAVDQRGYEIAEMWKQHLAQREADFNRVEIDLKEQLSASELKYEQLLDNVQSSSQEETNKVVMIEQINTLQSKLKDKEEHLGNLQNKYSEILNQLELMRSEMEDERVMHENKLLNQQEEYEKQIIELTVSHEEKIKSQSEEVHNLQTELNSTKNDYNASTTDKNHLRTQYTLLESKLAEITSQINTKDSEINQKTQDYTHMLSERNEEFESLRHQLIDYEKKIEDLSYEKESELAMLRLKMHESVTYYEEKQKEYEKEKTDLSETLHSKVTECINLNKQLLDLNNALQNNSMKMTEMQVALENQEYEIVTLKDGIANLETLLKTSSNKNEKHVTFASDTKPASDDKTHEENRINKELLDAVPRAELDLALYMLHQRDVRCEELTMELTQLLDERDTLQLRLSDSLRSFEDLKLKCKSVGLDLYSSPSKEAIMGSPTSSCDKEQQFVDIHRTSRQSSVSEPELEQPKLQAKLSELRSVRQSRDVVLRHESEERERGMRLLQRDVALLPSEAAEQLRQAHHTLSRDSQSTSTVLLNWLRGKSTPRVEHM